MQGNLHVRFGSRGMGKHTRYREGAACPYYNDQEQLRTVLLDTKNRIQAINTVYIGSLNMSMVRVGEVFKEAVRRNSSALIVVHNHPSGDATPSPEDSLVTREIVQAGKLLDIDVLDHLIIGHGVWISLRERGLGFDTR
jgi:DNA repair protein RadC